MTGEALQPADVPVVPHPDPDFAKRLRGELIAAARPSHRLFHAHPAPGLKEVDGECLLGARPHELGVRWHALEPEEQQARLRDVLHALLRRAASWPEARFEGRWSDDPVRTAALAEACGLAVTDREAVYGQLTEAVIAALVAAPPEVLAVDGGPDLVVVLAGGLDGVCVWIDRWQAPALQGELQTAWWERWREREAANEATGAELELRRREAANRELRAHVYVGWHRRGRSLTVAGLLAGAAALSLGEGWLRWLELLVVVLAVVWSVDRLVERWLQAGGP